MSVWQQPASDEVRDALMRVYARPEFVEQRVPALVQLMRDLWAALREWVGRLLRMVLPDSSSDVWTYVVIALLVIAAAWALTQLLGSLLDSGAGSQTRALTAQPTAERRSAAWWEEAARAAAAKGQYRDAALALYLAVVLRLEQSGIVRYHPGKTPGDYRREVRPAANVRTPFDGFVRELLPLAFGARQPDAAMFDALRSHAAELGVHA